MIAGQDFRAPTPGMGEGVVRRTYARSKNDGSIESWGDIAHRVALGNALLERDAVHAQSEGMVSYSLGPEAAAEFQKLDEHIRWARLLTSGRHLQQGDAFQPYRGMEVFTNCSTAATSFALFYLLLNGSGVGRDYSDWLMTVDWDMAPYIVPVLAEDHPDRADAESWWPTPERARELMLENDTWFEVPDTREGWAKAVELVETLAFEGLLKDTAVWLDFSKVRGKGQPIRGMQNRPSSGPVPLMKALAQINEVRGKGWDLWKQAMHVDHFLADCVQVGGARRAARMSVKYWADPGAIEFARIKKEGGLWTSNNSLGVDAEFWREAKQPDSWGYHVFEEAIHTAYHDGTGEPGFINLDKLVFDETGIEVFDDGDIMGNNRYQLEPRTRELTKQLVRQWKRAKYKHIVNPCSEIVLNSLCGFCVIGDVVPFFANTLEEAADAFKTMARALVRVNTMDSFYRKEVLRTNRIGVGITAFHEWAWRFFGFSWDDVINENASRPMWETVAWFADEVLRDLAGYCEERGLVFPHTVFTGKPSGTVSKPFALTEGFHLPAFRRYLRGVQMDKTGSAAQIQEYRDKGFPIIEDVKDRPTVVVVQFPTEPTITTLGIPAKDFVCAYEATMEEQYRYLRLIEKWWLGKRGNQISYTLKFDPERVSFAEFKKTILHWQPLVRCCALMVATEAPGLLAQSKEKYGYLPEEPIADEDYGQLMEFLAAMEQAFDPETGFKCDTGACPAL